MSERKSNSLNEELKKREAAHAKERKETEILSLDNTQRVKVLSPGRLVTKRFLRNKLAIVGLCILIFMFLFAFIGPLFYPYSQTQIFYTYKPLKIDYASATERTEMISFPIEGAPEVHYSVKNRLNSYIIDMETNGTEELSVTDANGEGYVITKLRDGVYTLSSFDRTPVATYSEKAKVAEYNRLANSFTWVGEELGSGFEKAAFDGVIGNEGSFSYKGTEYSYTSIGKKQYAITNNTPTLTYTGAEPGKGFEDAFTAAAGASFEFDGVQYALSDLGNGVSEIAAVGDKHPVLVASNYVFNMFDPSVALEDSFRADTLYALAGSGEFEWNGKSYTVSEDSDKITVYEAGEPLAELSTFVTRRYSGDDTLSIEFKDAVQEQILSMRESNSQKSSFVFSLPEMDEQANYITDENGDYIYVDTNLEINLKNNAEYVINCEQTTYLIDIYSTPAKGHIFGTDGDGMDIFARMMYGGRISLLVGFVVVIMESLLGVILGGIAGFFGGWIDTLIMRLVDIFYCIPTYPILIIMGAFFDAIKMDPYERLMWLMVILGILGWAAIARLVRGQILSLREQEFMVAQEATGMKSRRRIARHLIPNVMPQLIVNATMGLGSVIITESTLSFLGLGVKHPLATWGTMINSVTSSSENMIRYTYIWVPVGLLICLTVIAFNFVGDGLRDAFDPKMKQ